MLNEMLNEVREFEQPQVDSEDEANAGSLEGELQAFLIPSEYSTVDLPQSVPSEILLGSVRDSRLRVLSPIHVRVSKEDASFVLEAAELNEFGFGDTISEALADLQRAISELYFSLEADRDRLGSDLSKVRQVLAGKLEAIAP